MRGPKAVVPEHFACKLLKYSHGGNSERYSIDYMVRNTSATSGGPRIEACGASRSTEGAQPDMTILRAGSWAVICLLRWVVFEVLPLPKSTRGYHVVGATCRLVGCGVSFGILSVALQARATSHGEVLALLWAASALTALLISGYLDGPRLSRGRGNTRRPLLPGNPLPDKNLGQMRMRS